MSNYSNLTNKLYYYLNDGIGELIYVFKNISTVENTLGNDTYIRSGTYTKSEYPELALKYETTSSAVVATARGTISSGVNQIIFANNFFTSVGNTGSILMSADGISWDNLSSTPAAVNLVVDSTFKSVYIFSYGQVTLDSSIKKFGTTSLSFVGGFVSPGVIDNRNFAFGTGDFTIECWIYKTSSNATIFTTMNSNNSSTGISVWTSSGIGVAIGSTNLISNAGSMGLNTWIHVAVTRESGVIRAFLDGVEVGNNSTGTAGTNFTDTNCRISGQASGTIDFINGYLDDVRITKGVARYTANFSVPDSPFPDSYNEGDEYFENVSLLLHMEATGIVSDAVIGTSSTIYSITYGNGLYVYAGAGGALATSTNSITWTARTSGTTSNILSVTYGNGLYVYAGVGGVLATSTDAITWTARTSGTTNAIHSITYGNNLFVYGGFGGVLATSTDAITWTARTSGTTSTIYSITYGNGLYLFGTNNGLTRKSPDAITWVSNSTLISYTVYSITYANGLYVYGQDFNRAGVSLDSITWTGITLNGSVRTIAYGREKFVFGYSSGAIGYVNDFFTTSSSTFIVPSNATATISQSSTTHAIYSYVRSKKYSNFTNSVNYPIGTLYYGAIAPAGYIETDKIYSQSLYPDLFNAIGLVDANAWSEKSLPNASFGIYSIIYANNLYVAVGASGRIYTSTDADTWTQRSSGTSSILRSVVYANSIFVAGGDGGVIVTSTDALTWTSRVSGGNSNINTVFWDGTKFIAQGTMVASSSDGINWICHWNRRCWSGKGAYSPTLGMAALVGESGVIITSSDGGINWVVREYGVSSQYTNIIWTSVHNLFIAGGTSGIIRTSSDGITWTSRSTGTTSQIAAISKWNGSYYIGITTTAGSIVRSTDGINWSLVTGAGTPGVNWPYKAMVAFSSTMGLHIQPGGTIYKTTLFDGTGWTNTSTSFGFYSYILDWDPVNNLWFACSGNTMRTSPDGDGVTWTQRGSFAGTIHDAVWTGTAWIVTGSGRSVSRSTDLITWTSYPSAIIGSEVAALAAGDGVVYAGAGYDTEGSVLFRSTDDGITWQSAVVATIKAILPNGGNFLLFSNSAVTKLFTAENAIGRNSTYNTSINFNVEDAIYNNGLYLIAGTSGLMQTSTDAITWTSRTSGTTSTINALTYGNNLYVYVGTFGAFGTSTDAITWSNRYSGTTSSIYSVYYYNNLYLYGNNLISTSTDAITLNASYNVSTEFLIPKISTGSSNALRVYIKSTL